MTEHLLPILRSPLARHCRMRSGTAADSGSWQLCSGSSSSDSSVHSAASSS